MNIAKFVGTTALFLVVLNGSALARKADVPVDPGPQPSLEEFRSQAQAALVQSFFDPLSATFQWDRGLAGGYWRPLFQGKIPGWFTCGFVNGKNRFGGYVGYRRFVVVMRSGQIVYSEVAEGGDFDLLAMQCAKAIDNGVLPPAQVASAPTMPGSIQIEKIDPAKRQFGFSAISAPDGGYIVRVVPGSSADKSSLASGMVISHLNGLPLKGLDNTTIAKLILGAQDEITVTIIGKGDVKLTRAPIGVQATQ